MRPLPTLGPAVLLVIGVAMLWLAAGDGAAETLRANVLAPGTLLSYETPKDNLIANGTEGADNAESAAVTLRSGQGLPVVGGGARSVYLLSVGPGGGNTIARELRDRYTHANLTNATLRFSIDAGGCSSPSGAFVVRTIRTRSWNPDTIEWRETELGGGTNLTFGDTIARHPQTPSAPDCASTNISLNAAALAPVLTGDLGGLAVFWEGEQTVGIRTVDHNEAEGGEQPQMWLRIEPNRPRVTAVRLDTPAPRPLALGDAFSITARVTDNLPLPSDGVSLRITRVDSGDPLDTVLMDAAGGNWTGIYRSQENAAHEGLYHVAVVARDSDGWDNVTRAGNGTSDLVLDGTPPLVLNATLGGTTAGATVTGDQAGQLRLRLNVSETTCRGGIDPCILWTLRWQGRTLAQGSAGPPLLPGGYLELDTPVELPAPGTGTARLRLEDPLGFASERTWDLTVRDTHPPEAIAAPGAHVGPGRATILEQGTPLRVALRVVDDLPVEAALVLTSGNDTIRHPLPAPDIRGNVTADITGIPRGTYDATLTLSDGSNPAVELAWGQLTIQPPGPPTITITPPHAGDRVRPGDVVTITVRDAELDPERVRINATLGGRPLTLPTRSTLNGTELTLRVTLAGLRHGDQIRLNVTATDRLGLASPPAGSTLRVDAAPPRLTEPAAGAWFGPTAVIRFAAEDEGRSTLTVTGPAGTAEGPSPLAVNLTRILRPEHGNATLTIHARDDVGNNATGGLPVGVDALAPATEARFDDDGLLLLVRDEGAGVQTLRVEASVGNGSLGAVPQVLVAPGQYRPSLPELRRGDQIRIAVTATDRVGNVGRLGTLAEPHTIDVPDRPPSVTLERVLATPPPNATRETLERFQRAAFANATIVWRVSDPDGDELEIELLISGPGGGTPQRRSVNATGEDLVEPGQDGRYVVRLSATAAGATRSRNLTLYLATDGQLADWDPLPRRVGPDEPLEIALSFPHAVTDVRVSAVGPDNVTRAATVQIQGPAATARFAELPRGRHDLALFVQHEPGVVETASLGTVNVAPSLGQRLQDALVPALVVLAVLGLVALAVLFATRRDRQKS